MKLKIAAVNLEKSLSWQENVAKAEKTIGNAIENGVDILLFPEGFPLLNRDEKGVQQGIKRLAKLTRKRKICVVISSTTLHGVAAHVLLNGKEIGRQYKTHHFANDPRKVVPRDVEIFSYKGIKFGIAICYSLFFPETTQLFRLKKASFVLAPLVAAEGQSGIFHSLIRTRAFESSLPVIASGVISRFQKSEGHCIVAFPDWTYQELGRNKEGMIVTSVDLHKWSEFRRKKSSERIPARRYFEQGIHSLPSDRNWHVLKKATELQKREIRRKLK